MRKMTIELQQRDVELLRFVYAHRVVSYSQVLRKFFTDRHKSTAAHRLKRLRKHGYVKSAFMPIRNGCAERYLMPSEKSYEVVRHHWGFEIDRPHYKSESIVHDLRLVDLVLRMEKLTQFQKLLPENLLQSSSSLTHDPHLGDLVRAQSDGALYIAGKSGRGFLFALEMELSTKNIERYKSKLSSYYLAERIDGVLYVCADQVIVSLLAKADKEARKDQRSRLHFVLEADAIADSDKITFRNTENKSFNLR